MRRAVFQALRSTRRPLLHKAPPLRTAPIAPSSHAITQRFLSTPRSQVLHSSMHFRRFSVALVTAAVASGAWYYKQATQQTSNDSTSAGSTAQSASVVLGDTTTAPHSTRKALVVEQGQLYSGTIVGDGPISKDTDESGRKVIEMMTPEQVTKRLRTNEESWMIGRGNGVVRYDVVQLPSNDPIEDDHAEKIIEVPQTTAATDDGSTASDWMFWGVFDGHSGWTTSAKLRQTLISYVARELNSTYIAALANPAVTFPTSESVDQAIKTGFTRLDNEIVHESVTKVTEARSKRVAAELLAPALSGSCALLSFYDSRSKLLKVACTGDSRAVIGRRGANGKWTAEPLSIDQTGGNVEEDARLRKEHPGEEYVTHNGRILGGLEPSRAFGDAFYKWSLETQLKLKKSYFGRTPSKLLKSPPYVTAEPIITTTKVQPQNGDFVVMATDGLWEMLTNEEVVGLVGQWLEAQGSQTNASSSSWLKSWFSAQPKVKELPVEDKKGADPGGQRAPVRQVQWGIQGGAERFVVKDKNAATHLVRNALGGKDEDQLCALLTLPSPYSRRYRDDLTVEVIFFGEGPTGEKVTLNEEASAKVVSEDVKAKL